MESCLRFHARQTYVCGKALSSRFSACAEPSCAQGTKTTSLEFTVELIVQLSVQLFVELFVELFVIVGFLRLI